MNTIAFTINVTFGWWILPAILTFILLCIMFRPLDTHKNVRNSNSWIDSNFLFDGIESVFRLLWFIPILLIWVVYLWIKLLIN